ncbi:MAG: hypothetical protein OSA92_02345 [Pirellulaceae bacterium]|nr:hypothetical protein [Pirellulaceae bacterium]
MPVANIQSHSSTLQSHMQLVLYAILICGICFARQNFLLHADESLPWNQDNISDQQLPFSIAHSTTAEQILEISGIGPSELRFLIDLDPVIGKDIDTIGKLLAVFPKVSESDIQRLTKPTVNADAAVTLDMLVSDVDRHRIKFFTIRGRATSVKRQYIIPEAARLIGFNSFFWVTIKADDSDIPVRIATRKIPIAWFPDSWKRPATATEESPPAATQRLPFEIDEPILVDGLLLKTTDENQQLELIMAASRVKWLPSAVSTEQHVHSSMVLLSQHGFDSGLLDEIRRTNKSALGHNDREAFYQILKIFQPSSALDAIQQVHQQAPPLNREIVDYFNDTRALQGQFVTVSGDVRQISRIAIVNSKMQHRFGSDHYWQLDLSIPIGKHRIRVKTNDADQDGIIFQNRFPLQVCVNHLHHELQKAMNEMRQGRDERKLLREKVTVQGVFFKLWSYQTALTMRDGPEREQLSPLIIASTIRMHEKPIIDQSDRGIYVAIAFIVAMLCITVFLVRVGREDRQSKKRTAQTRHRLEDLGELIDIDTHE